MKGPRRRRDNSYYSQPDVRTPSRMLQDVARFTLPGSAPSPTCPISSWDDQNYRGRLTTIGIVWGMGGERRAVQTRPVVREVFVRFNSTHYRPLNLERRNWEVQSIRWDTVVRVGILEMTPIACRALRQPNHMSIYSFQTTLQDKNNRRRGIRKISRIRRVAARLPSCRQDRPFMSGYISVEVRITAIPDQISQNIKVSYAPVRLRYISPAGRACQPAGHPASSRLAGF